MAVDLWLGLFKNAVNERILFSIKAAKKIIIILEITFFLQRKHLKPLALVSKLFYLVIFGIKCITD